MSRKFTRASALFVTLAVTSASAVLAGVARSPTYPYGLAAIHVVQHGTNCKTLTPFQNTSQINTTYIGTGDIDVIPVFFEINGYRAIEFGLTWPAEWGSCSFTTCGTAFGEGSIINPGDDMFRLWSDCQLSWSAVAGYGWLTAQSSGQVELVPPDYGHFGLGVIDCDDVWHPLYGTYSAGVGWINGDNLCPCTDPLYATMTNSETDTCVAAGDTLTYVISLDNFNYTAIHEVVLSDSIPPGTAYVSGGTYIPEANCVVWNAGTVETNYTISFSIRVTDMTEEIMNHCAISCKEFWPKSVSDTIRVCSDSPIEPTTWGSIKAIYR